MFKRWESLVCPLRCVVVVMKESAVSRIFRGAAKRGIEALSELDASRVDLVNRKRDVNWRVIDKHLRKVMREMPPSLQGLSEYTNDEQFLQAARSALGDAESADALFNAAIVAQRQALAALADTGAPPPEVTLPFAELQAAVGFPEYYAEEEKYRV